MGKRGKRSPQKDEPLPPKKVANRKKTTPPRSQRGGGASRGARGSTGGAARVDGAGGGPLTGGGATPAADASFDSPPAAHVREEFRPRFGPVQRPPPMSPRSQHAFNRDCLPKQVLAPARTPPPSPASSMDEDGAQQLERMHDEPLPADGMASPPRWDDAQPAAAVACPPAYESSKVVQHTRRTSLKAALGKKRPDLLQPLMDLVLYGNFLRGLTWSLLDVYANALAMEVEAAGTDTLRTVIINREYRTQASLKAGTLFGQQLIADALQMVHNRIEKGPPPPPPTTGRATRGNVEAAPPPRSLMQRVFDEFAATPKVAAVLDTTVVPKAYCYDLISSMIESMVQNIGDIFGRTNAIMQRLLLRMVHGLRGKEAKAVQKRLALAKSDQLGKALTLDSNAAKRKVYLAEAAEIEAEEAATAASNALYRLQTSNDASPAAVAEAETAVAAANDKLSAKMSAHRAAKAALEQMDRTLSAAEKEASIERLHTTPFPPRKRRACPSSEEEEEAPDLPSLLDILVAEIAELPDNRRQEGGLLYRFRMMQRLKAVGVEKGALLPQPHLTIGFISFTLGTLTKLLDNIVTKKTRIGDNTVDVRLKDMCEAKVLSDLKSKWPSFGPTIKTDGVQLHLTVVNDAFLDKKEAESSKQKKTKKKLAKGVAPEEKEEEEKEVRPNVELRKTEQGAMVVTFLDEDSIVTTLDGGVRNVYGAARSKFVSEWELGAGPLFKPSDMGERVDRGLWTLSTRQARHDMRCPQRRRKQERRLQRLRKSDPDFAAAEKIWNEASVSTTDPAKLMEAVQSRAAVFLKLIKGYEGYSGPGSGFHQARARFDASIAEEAYWINQARRLVPTEKHFVACGDAKFGGLRGSASGCFSRLRRALEEHFPSNILPDVPENRTSKLDPVHHCVMTNPIKGLARDRKGKLHMRRVHGHLTAALRDLGYNVRWGRDMQTIFWHGYHNGKAPSVFLKSKPKSELMVSDTARYSYSVQPGQRRFVRTVKAS